MTHVPDEVLSHSQAAEFLGVSTKTLKRWHSQRIGPPRCKAGQTIFYLKSSVLTWLKSREQEPLRKERVST